MTCKNAHSIYLVIESSLELYLIYQLFKICWHHPFQITKSMKTLSCFFQASWPFSSNQVARIVEGRKQSKERITIVVCANGNGSNKLPLLVIGKYKNPHCFKISIAQTWIACTGTTRKHRWLKESLLSGWRCLICMSQGGKWFSW